MKSKILFGLMFVFSVGVAQAQPGGFVTFRSLETKIAESPVVLRVTLTNVLETIVHTNNERGVAYDYFNYTVAWKMNEVLKGKQPVKTLAFTINHVGRWADLAKWAGERASFLWFWNAAAKDIGEDFHGVCSERVIFLGPTLPGQRDEGGFAYFPPVYDMDMTILTKPEDILTRARAFAKKRIANTNFHSLHLPLQSNGEQYFSLSYLVVPVEPSLEKTAKRLIATPEDFLTAGHKTVSEWRCGLRASGAGALQYFKSSQNIKLLKSLLDAPDCPDEADTIYSLRYAAYRVLKGWGIEVPKPVTSETALPGDSK